MHLLHLPFFFYSKGVFLGEAPLKSAGTLNAQRDSPIYLGDREKNGILLC